MVRDWLDFRDFLNFGLNYCSSAGWPVGNSVEFSVHNPEADGHVFSYWVGCTRLDYSCSFISVLVIRPLHSPMPNLAISPYEQIDLRYSDFSFHGPFCVDFLAIHSSLLYARSQIDNCCLENFSIRSHLPVSQSDIQMLLGFSISSSLNFYPLFLFLQVPPSICPSAWTWTVIWAVLFCSTKEFSSGLDILGRLS